LTDKYTMYNSAFKTCPRCGKKWTCRNDFINDPDLTVVGYQANFKNLVLGLFLFDHSCKTTLSAQAGLFMDMYSGAIFTECKAGTDECHGFCLHKSVLRPCPAKCECAYVREVLQILQNIKFQNTNKYRSTTI
jgi:hypothetical protein